MIRTLRSLPLAIALLEFFCSSVSAQRYLGIATSNWCTVNSLYLNPANIAGCNEKISIGILSFNAAINSNLGHIPRIPDIGKTLNNNDNIFNRSDGKSFSMLLPAAVVRGPAIMLRTNKNLSLALTTAIRGINQFNNFDPALYKALTAIGDPAVDSYSVSARNFNWTAHMWSEVGITIAGTITAGRKHRLNGGVTVRRLGAIGYVSVLGDKMDFRFEKGTDNIYATNSDILYSSNIANDSSDALKNITPSGLFNKYFAGNQGGGFSTDFGITYAHVLGPQQKGITATSSDRYLVLSASVTDFGAIRYRKSSNYVLTITGEGSLSGQALDSNVKDVASLTHSAEQHGFKVQSEQRPITVYLPKALLLSADIPVFGDFYANLLFVGNLMNRMKAGNSYYDQLTLTPRYDLRKMTFALPLTYSALAHDFKMGISARYTGFYVGSDDVLALISKCQYGFNFYIGGYIPICPKRNRYSWY